MGEENFERNRVYDYLYLIDQAERDYYAASQPDDEEELLDNYIRAITDCIKAEVPILEKFFFETKIPIFFPTETLKAHSLVLAQIKSGKSEYLKILFYDLQRRSQHDFSKSLVLIEPHGDLSKEVLSFSLNSGSAIRGWERLVYLDPFIRDTALDLLGEDLFDEDYTFTINPFELENRTERNVNYMVQQLSKSFFDIVRNEMTPQMETLVEACIEVLLWRAGSNIVDLTHFMNRNKNEELIKLGLELENENRRDIIKELQSNSKFASSAFGVYMRLQSLIGDPFFCRLLTGKQTVNLEREINKGKVIICNVAKGRMGEKSSPVFGKLVTSLIQGAVTKRQDIPKHLRKETFTFMDEFQNYLITPTIENVMTESRKFSLHMVLAHQTYGQKMSKELRQIITSNTGVKIAGENDADSLEAMSKQMAYLRPKDFEKLPKYSFFTYNKFNKASGVLPIRVPDYLVKKRPPFYMNKTELKNLFLYLVHESGYYKKVETKSTFAKANQQQLEIPNTKSDKHSHTNKGMYIANFDE